MKKIIFSIFILLLFSSSAIAELPEDIEGIVTNNKIDTFLTPTEKFFNNFFAFVERPSEDVVVKCLNSGINIKPIHYTAGGSGAAGWSCRIGSYIIFEEVGNTNVAAKITYTSKNKKQYTFRPLFKNIWKRTTEKDLPVFNNFYLKNFDFDYKYSCYTCLAKTPTLQEKSCINKQKTACVLGSDDSCDKVLWYNWEQECLDHLKSIQHNEKKTCAQVTTRYYIIENNKCASKEHPNACLPEGALDASACNRALEKIKQEEAKPEDNKKDQCQEGSPDASGNCVNAPSATPPSTNTGEEERSSAKQEIYEVIAPKSIRLDDTPPAITVRIKTDKPLYVESFYVLKSNPWYQTYTNVAGGEKAFFSFLGISAVEEVQSCPEDFERKQTVYVSESGDVSFKMTPPLPRSGDVFGKERKPNSDLLVKDYLLVVVAFDKCKQTPSDGGIRVSKVVISEAAEVPLLEIPLQTCNNGLDDDQDGNLDDFPAGAGDSDCAPIVLPKNMCNKVVGERCSIKGFETINDDSIQSLECSTGWCSDLRGASDVLGVGECSLPPFGKVGHPQCAPSPAGQITSFDFCQYFSSFPDVFGIPKCYVGIGVVLFGLAVFIKLLKG